MVKISSVKSLFYEILNGLGKLPKEHWPGTPHTYKYPLQSIAAEWLPAAIFSTLRRPGTG
jgi:hypothetical protein